MSAGAQRFVAATDFSEHAGSAVHRAALLSAERGAQLELLHVVAKGSLDALREVFSAKPDSAANLVEDVRYMLIRSVSALAERTELVHAVDRGNPSRLILEKEQALQPDLIVMGKRQRPAAEQLLLGSVTRHALANCRSDVLIAPV